MSNLFIDTLDDERKLVFGKLPWLVADSGFYLAGGTALALQMNHRISYDFDLFGQEKIDPQYRKKVIEILGNSCRFTMDTVDQLSFFTESGVKITLAYTPYKPIYPLIDSSISISCVADIAADKAFTIGRRGVARDYVDLAYILRSDIALSQIIRDASRKYGAMFDEKLFLEQLDYMVDIQEFPITYIDNGMTKTEVETFLHTKIAEYVAI